MIQRAEVRASQRGMSTLGFLLLIVLIGVVALAGLRLVPMYIENYTLSTVLNELHAELDGQAASPVAIRSAIGKHLEIEGIDLPKSAIEIEPASTGGYDVRIQYENSAHYAGDIWLVVKFDKQTQIKQ